jgi:hypothetical protein
MTKALSASSQRPPSPVSAPPKRKKPTVTREGSKGRGEKPAVPEKSASVIKRASLTRESMKAAAAAAAARIAAQASMGKSGTESTAVKDGTESTMGKVGDGGGSGGGDHSVNRKLSTDSAATDSQAKPSVLAAHHSNTDAHSARDSASSAGMARDSASSTKSGSSGEHPGPHSEKPEKPEKPKPLVLEARGSSRDHRPQAVQHAIFSEVATETHTKDTPQLMKIKRIESPKTSDVSVLCAVFLYVLYRL